MSVLEMLQLAVTIAAGIALYKFLDGLIEVLMIGLTWLKEIVAEWWYWKGRDRRFKKWKATHDR